MEDYRVRTRLRIGVIGADIIGSDQATYGPDFSTSGWSASLIAA
jgi:hypothetical protein